MNAYASTIHINYLFLVKIHISKSQLLECAWKANAKWVLA